MKWHKIIFILLIAVASCKKSDKKNDDLPPFSSGNPPDKALLIEPAQNTVCANGKVISSSQVSISFYWNISPSTDYYELYIKNLSTGTTIFRTVTGNLYSEALTPNTPYSWYVVSKSKLLTSTATSDTWKFYVAGSSTTYSPFPAAVVSPIIDQAYSAGTSAVNLQWMGSDVDGDIVSYDVYLGTTTTPALFKADVTGMSLNNVAVATGKSYYWKVVTKDTKGNTSDSELFRFKVN
jgi:hypothetical protein